MTKKNGISRRNFTVAAVGVAWVGTAAPEAAAARPTPAAVSPPADDKLAIIELMALYAWSYDTSDVQGFAQTFTPDGVIEIFGKEAARGREALPAFLDTAYAMRKDNGWQHLTNHHVFQAYDGKSCTVYSYYLMPESDTSGGNVHLRAMGYYVSHCVKTDGRWLFAKRSVFRWNGKTPWKAVAA
jgi:hypothetical protein